MAFWGLEAQHGRPKICIVFARDGAIVSENLMVISTSLLILIVFGKKRTMRYERYGMFWCFNGHIGTAR